MRDVFQASHDVELLDGYSNAVPNGGSSEAEVLSLSRHARRLAAELQVKIAGRFGVRRVPSGLGSDEHGVRRNLCKLRHRSIEQDAGEGVEGLPVHHLGDEEGVDKSK